MCTPSIFSSVNYATPLRVTCLAHWLALLARVCGNRHGVWQRYRTLHLLGFGAPLCTSACLWLCCLYLFVRRRGLDPVSVHVPSAALPYRACGSAHRYMCMPPIAGHRHCRFVQPGQDFPRFCRPAKAVTWPFTSNFRWYRH